MDGVTQFREDAVLRRLLSNPEAGGHLGRPSPGFAALRVLIAAIDATQVVVVGVAVSAVFRPGHLIQAAEIGLLVAGLALLLRRGIRATTSFRKLTLGTVARRSGLAVVLSCFCILAIEVLLNNRTTARFADWIAIWAAVSALVSAALRASPIPLFRRIAQRAIRPTVAVVGTPSNTRLMTDMLSKQGTHQVVAQFDPDLPFDSRRLETLAMRGTLDKIVIVGCDESVIERVCLGLSDTPTLVCLGFATATASVLMSGGLHATQHPPFLPLLPNPMTDWRGLLKRGLDVGLVLMMAPLFSPVLIGAALAIKLESPGPVLFRQWRFGLGSKPTRILKFRTMYHDRGDQTGETRTASRDPRVTFVGRILRRTSIDELPQFLNVLRGEMSLVGPRPHATHMKVDGNYYFEAVQEYRMRHRVKPGITGWAQVTGSRGEIDSMDKAIERVDKDLWYVRNWSLALDLRILLMTAMGRFASPTAD